MNPYLLVILAVILIRYCLGLAAALLNLRHMAPDLPPEFADVFDADRYRRSQDYLRVNTRFAFVQDTFGVALTLLFILIGGFNLVDLAARNFGAGEIVTGLAFTAILVALSQVLDIPFSVYETFVIEERFGFNKTTPRTFALDHVKGWLLMAVIGLPVLAAVLWFFGAAGPLAWLYCWLGITAVQLFLVYIAPVVIMPLFNKFVPLEDGELKATIDGYARSQAFKLKGIYKMDGSRRSSKTNAFFTGFGRLRRIVLFDTLIARHTVSELLAVIAHEMGHCKKKHVLKHMIASIATSGIMFFLLSLFIGNRSLFDAFRMERVSIYAGIVFFGFLYAPISLLLGILQNAVSRKHEYEADAYVVATTGTADALVGALKKLSADNLSNLTPHPLKVVLSYSHPPVLQRIRQLKRVESAGIGNRAAGRT